MERSGQVAKIPRLSGDASDKDATLDTQAVRERCLWQSQRRVDIEPTLLQRV